MPRTPEEGKSLEPKPDWGEPEALSKPDWGVLGGMPYIIGVIRFVNVGTTECLRMTALHLSSQIHVGRSLVTSKYKIIHNSFIKIQKRDKL